MEWTKEQRAAAEAIYAWSRELDRDAVWIRLSDGHKYPVNPGVLKLQCELTAALSEIERLKSELMGELAVGGWLSVSQELPPLDLPIDLWIQFKSGEGWRLADCSRTWVGNEGWFWVQGDDGEHIEEHGIEADDVAYWQPQPAPPFGEQAAMKSERYKRFEEKVCESYLREIGEFGPVEVQDTPKGEV